MKAKRLLRLIIAVSFTLLMMGVVSMSTSPRSYAYAGSQKLSPQVMNPNISSNTIIARAKTWLNPQVPYNQHGYHNGYREDCSGYVSMAWELSTPGLTTYTLGTVSHQITESDLQPGDVLLNANGGGNPNLAHAVIFNSWANPQHTAYNGYEESPYVGGAHYSTNLPYPYWSGDDPQGYVPMRYNGFAASYMVGMASTSDGHGYWLVGNDGGVFTYGDGHFYGSMGGKPLNAPVVGMAATPNGGGYWLVAADGGIFNFGNAGFHGSMGGQHLNAPVVGMAVTPDGQGYWLVAADGGIFNFGDAGFYGSMGGQHLNAPVVGMAATPDGRGYWLVAADGGMFAFGDAGFYGSMGGQHLNAPVVGMARTPNGGGYWLVAADGGIFNFGNAAFYGSMGGQQMNAPVVGMAATPDGGGYWLVGGDGGVFTFGDAGFYGSFG